MTFLHDKGTAIGKLATVHLLDRRRGGRRFAFQIGLTAPFVVGVGQGDGTDQQPGIGGVAGF